MRIQRPVLADLALQAQLLAVRGQDQLDGGGVEADAVVQRLHVVALVDATDGHHRHQDVHRLDQARVAREQRLAEERLVGLHHVVDPGAGDIHARQVGRAVDDLVDLGDHDAVAERGGFHQRRRILGARARVQVAVAVGLVAGRQYDVRRQVDIEPRIQLDIGVDGAYFQQPVFQELRDPHALGAGIGKVELAGDAALEQVQVLHPAHARDDHVQVMQARRIGLGQRPRQEIGLLLVVAFQHHAVAGGGNGFEESHDVAGGHHLARGDLRAQVLAAPLLGAARVPLSFRYRVQHGVSGVLRSLRQR